METPNTITVYTRDNCQQCKATERKLAKEGLAFAEINTSHNEEAAETLRSLGFMAAPVVMTPEGESWGGYRPDLIAEYADRQRAAQ